LGVTDEGARITRWWATEPAEIFWLEVGARGVDLGLDLNAPLLSERGRPFWSYDLVDHVAEGDLVLHYDRDERAILAWSIAVGSAWRDTVIWAARGTYARGLNIVPHERPGRRLSLNGPIRLSQPLSLERMRDVRPQLEEMRRDRPYFPFELGSRPPRPVQGYLFKLPAAFVELFPELDGVPRTPERAAATLPAPDSPLHRATPERPAFVPRNEEVRSRQARPWLRDPSEVDRALSSHARIERLVAEAARAEGWAPQAMGPGDPPFDLLVTDGTGQVDVVVEVKSTTGVNEEKQLRLALGQVLRYRQVLRATGRKVEAIIAVEHEPDDASWIELCRDVDVLLTWPGVLNDVLREVVRRMQKRH